MNPFSPKVTRFLLRMLKVYGRHCHENGGMLPEEGQWLYAVLTGPEGTNRDTPAESRDAGDMRPLLLTFDEAASRTRLSAKTLRRRATAGDLATVKCGRARRIHPEDLELFVGKLRKEN